MTEANRRKKPKPKQEKTNAAQRSVPAPIDEQNALSQRLKTLYGAITDEPVPADMLRLLKPH